MSDRRELVLTTPLYGGELLAGDGSTRVPFAIPEERVAIDGGTLMVLQRSPFRVLPACQHFGECGGCQYQMAAYDEQVRMKHFILRGLLKSAGVEGLPEIFGVHTGEPYAYRNRIRLRLARVDGRFRFGYNRRGSTEFLPIAMCPIAAPILWSTAEALLQLASVNVDVERLFAVASELELFANHDLSKLQLTFACAPRVRLDAKSFERAMQAAQGAVPEIAGAAAIAVDPRTGPTGKVLASGGSAGLAYRVSDESYWVTRGGFFQVNRFLIETLVKLVCDGRSGELAWDLFAGVGLFSRVLARSFARVTAVETTPTAVADLRTALRKLSSAHEAVEATTNEFLQRAVLQRERPELIVLDPPRAGARVEACELLLKLEAAEIMYVSCDPTTLARDLAVLQRDYRIAELNMVDLFPQTFHMETVVVLRHK